MSGLDRGRYRQDVQDVNYAARKTVPSALIWLGVFIAVIAAIGIGTWYFKVATSGVKGAGDATRQVNSGANRLQAQAKYAQLHEGILAADKNITTLAQAAAASPTQVNQTNLTGAQNICQQHVAEYNAMAVNALTAQWRPIELPSRLGDDKASDCQPDPIPTPSK
jgi:hypothetical protein